MQRFFTTAAIRLPSTSKALLGRCLAASFAGSKRTAAGSAAYGRHVRLQQGQPVVEGLSSSLRTEPQEIELEPIIQNVALDVESRFIRIFWEDGTEDEYPFVWLRDNCQCSTCFNPDAQGRLVILAEMDTKTTPTYCSVVNGTLTVGWPNGHRSSYTAKWLKDRSFCFEAIKKRMTRQENRVLLWGSEIQHQIPTYSYNEVTNSDRQLYSVLSDLNEAGLALIKGCPIDTNFMEDFTDRIGPPFISHYGRTFHVKNKINPSNVAYTGSRLGVHSDLPYYLHVPAFQFMHCISQYEGQGGDNQLVDAFNVANQLREVDPQAFDILTNFKVDMIDTGYDFIEFYKVTSKPVICLTREGDVECINYNNQVRDSVLNIPAELVQTFYDCKRKFATMLYYPNNLIHVKLEPGDLMMFANYRVLHGRNAFNALQGERHLIGSYVSLDELRSRLRVLGRKLGYY